jgi:hypothetical protein
MKKYLFIVLLVGVCFGQNENKNTGEIIESAGDAIVEYVDDNYRAFYLGLAGAVIANYGASNPIKTSEGYRGTTYTTNPAVYAGFTVIVFSIYKQITSFKKLKTAGEKLKTAGQNIRKATD